MQSKRVFCECQKPAARRSSRIFHTTIPMFVAIFILGFAVCANAQTVTVNFGSGNGHQFISGFGGGLKHYSFDWGPLPQAVFNTLFGLESTGATDELGLGITRITVDPAGQDYYAPLNVAPYRDGWGWDAEASYGYQAEAMGAMVMASVPVPYCKQDGNTSDCYTTTDEVGINTEPLAYLATSHYADYGTWLAGYITYLEGLPSPLYLTGISLADEPNNPQAAFGNTNWSASEFDNWLKDAGDASPITDADPNVRIMFPESVTFDPTTLADTALDDSSAAQNVGIVNGHCFGGDENIDPPVIDPYATSLGIPEWLTECGDREGVYHTQLWGDGITEAQSIAAWMNAKYKAYIWFNAIDAGAEPNDNFIFDNGFVNYKSCGASTCTIEPEGAAMGQYSEWVRPGYQVVTSSSSNLYVSAYQGEGNFVIVVVNTGSAVTNEAFTVEGLTALTSSEFNVYQSSASSKSYGTCGTGASEITCLKSEGTVTATLSGSNYTFTYPSIPAYSVMTFVGTGTSTLEMLANRNWPTGDMAGWDEHIGTGSVSDFTVPKDTSLSGDFYALKEYDANNSFTIDANQIIKNQPSGSSYTFSTYAKTDGTSTYGYLQVMDPGVGTLCTKDISNVTAWTSYSCSGTVPSSGSLQVILGTSGSPAGEWVKFGGVTLTVTPP